MLNPIFWNKVQGQKHPGRSGIIEHQIPSIKVLFKTNTKCHKHPSIRHLSKSKTQLVNQRKQRVAFSTGTAHSPEIQSYRTWWYLKSGRITYNKCRATVGLQHMARQAYITPGHFPQVKLYQLSGRSSWHLLYTQQIGYMHIQVVWGCGRSLLTLLWICRPLLIRMLKIWESLLGLEIMQDTKVHHIQHMITLNIKDWIYRND